MRIQCLLGPASTTVGSTTYDFTRDEDGRFIADVHDLVHVKCLLSMEGVYAEPRTDIVDSVVDVDENENASGDDVEYQDDDGSEEPSEDAPPVQGEPVAGSETQSKRRRGGRRRRAV